MNNFWFERNQGKIVFQFLRKVFENSRKLKYQNVLKYPSKCSVHLFYSRRKFPFWMNRFQVNELWLNGAYWRYILASVKNEHGLRTLDTIKSMCFVNLCVFCFQHESQETADAYLLNAHHIVHDVQCQQHSNNTFLVGLTFRFVKICLSVSHIQNTCYKFVYSLQQVATLNWWFCDNFYVIFSVKIKN